jgi:uncharacterized coiled-coil protein SlyX
MWLEVVQLGMTFPKDCGAQQSLLKIWRNAMMDDNWDPYDQLAQLTDRADMAENMIETLADRMAQACVLMEQMAQQVQTLSHAVARLQHQNQILHRQITRFEETHG